MAKIYERVLSTNILREKRRDSFDLLYGNLLGEDRICMVNFLEIRRVMLPFHIDATYLIKIRREAQGIKCSKKPEQDTNLGNIIS